MARIREFRGLRPARELASRVAELPYDVLSSGEAAEIARDNPYSFFHISKPEIDLPHVANPHDARVYETARQNLERFRAEGILRLDEAPRLYLYTQVMGGRPQTGLVACAHIDDYRSGVIKRHELTREDKEIDRSRHLDVLNANAGPVFLFYREDGSKRALFERASTLEPEYDFLAPDGVRHILRVVEDAGLIESFKRSLAGETLYIADGHHRAASAVRVGGARAAKNPHHTGNEEYNWFLSVIFPHSELRILPYNRVLRDLNGLSERQFMEKLEERFSVTQSDSKEPEAPHVFCLYLGGRWHRLVPRRMPVEDVIKSLDVSILQDEVLAPILGIDDPRRSTRIEFVGGIRGVEELERLVDGGAFRAAFSMHPTTIEQLMGVSDSGAIMPPKSTWFEPKLRSGIVLHLLD